MNCGTKLRMLALLKGKRDMSDETDRPDCFGEPTQESDKCNACKYLDECVKKLCKMDKKEVIYYEYAEDVSCPNCASNDVKRQFELEKASNRIFSCNECGIYFQLIDYFSVEKKQIPNPSYE